MGDTFTGATTAVPNLTQRVANAGVINSQSSTPTQNVGIKSGFTPPQVSLPGGVPYGHVTFPPATPTPTPPVTPIRQAWQEYTYPNLPQFIVNAGYPKYTGNITNYKPVTTTDVYGQQQTTEPQQAYGSVAMEHPVAAPYGYGSVWGRNFIPRVQGSPAFASGAPYFQQAGQPTAPRPGTEWPERQWQGAPVPGEPQYIGRPVNPIVNIPFSNTINNRTGGRS
jgi:hypothetical protein